MSKKYIIQAELDVSGVKKGAAEANAALTDLGNNKVMLEVDYDHGNIDDLRNTLASLTASSPEIKVQLDYDLFNATLKQKRKELENSTPLYNMLLGEKKGEGQLSDYVSNILKEVEDGLYDGLPKKELEERMKKAMDLAASYEKITGKNIDDDTLDYMEELQEEFKNLDDYEPRNDLFTSVTQDVKNTTTIIKGLELQIDDLKSKGAIDSDDIIDLSEIRSATTAIDDIGNTIQETQKQVKSSGKIRFFDGIKESVLDVKDDAKEIDELFERLSKSWSDIQFRTGSEFVDTKHRHDNLGLQLETGYDEPSFGNGTYFAQNFKDILKWKQNNKYPSIFASNLSNVEKMLRVESDDYLDVLQDAMRSMHALISKDLFPNDNYEDMLNGITDVSGLYDAFKQQFSDLNVSQEALGNFIESQKKYLSTFVRENGEIPKELYSAESITSKFFTELVGVYGISTSNLGRGDSSDYGSVIFKNLAKSLPYLDFGNNEELARKFAEMTLSNILKKKANNPNVDLDEVYRQLTNTFQKDFDVQDFTKMAQSSLYNEDTLRSLYDTLQEAKKIQAKLNPLSTKDLNKSLFSNDGNEDLSNISQDKINTSALSEIPEILNRITTAADEAADSINRLNDGIEGIDAGTEALQKQAQHAEETAGELERLYSAIKYVTKSNGDIVESDLGGGLRAEDIKSMLKGYKYDPNYQMWFSKASNMSYDIKDESGATLDHIPGKLEEISTAANQASASMERFNDVLLDGENIGEHDSDEFDALKKELEEVHSRNIEQANIIERLQDEKYREEDRADQAESNSDRLEQRINELEEQLSRANQEKDISEGLMNGALEAQVEAEEKYRGLLDLLPSVKPQEAEVESNVSGVQLDTDLGLIQEDTDDVQRNTEAVEENTDAYKENADAKREPTLVETQAETDSIRESTEEVEKNTEAKKENNDIGDGGTDIGQKLADTEATRENTEETERNTTAKKENKEAGTGRTESGDITVSTEDIRENTEEIKRNTEYQAENRLEKERSSGSIDNDLGHTAGESASNIQAEVDALNTLSAAATLAAANKSHVTTENISLGSAALVTTARIQDEADALDELSKSAKDAAKNKERATKSQSVKNETVSKTGSGGGGKRNKKKTPSEQDLDDQFSWLVDKYTSIEKDINNSPILKNIYSEDLEALRGVMNSVTYDPSSIEKFRSDLNGLVSDVISTQSAVDRAKFDIGSKFDNLLSNRKVLQEGIKGLGKNPDDQISAKYLEEYNAELNKTIQLVDEFKNKYGSTGTEIDDIEKIVGNYKDSMSGYLNKQIDDSTAKYIDRINNGITRQENNGTDYTEAFKSDITEAISLLQNLSNARDIAFNNDGSINIDYINDYINGLQKAKDVIANLNNPANIKATQGETDNILRHINKDMQGSLYGDVKAGYEDLRNELLRIKETGEEIDKETLRGFVDRLKDLNQQSIALGMNKPSFSNQFTEAIKNQSAQFLATYFSLQDFVRYGKEIAQTVTSLDSAMVELRKVSGETDQRLDLSFKNSTQTAKELGAEITSVINSTADWSRLGYSIDEAEELARVTQIYQNVGDNLTQDTASEYLVSTLQGFHIDSEEALRVVDSINAVANNYAVDTQMIGESLERSAASFNASGTSLDKSIALVSATAEVTQDAASAGTVWKTDFCFGVQKCASRTHLKPVMPKALLLQCG